VCSGRLLMAVGAAKVSLLRYRFLSWGPCLIWKPTSRPGAAAAGGAGLEKLALGQMSDDCLRYHLLVKCHGSSTRVRAPRSDYISGQNSSLRCEDK
jgi:hypothetical protein